MTKKTEIKLIALDMDGTLLTSKDEVSEANKLAIKKARDKGVAVMISTGRWLDSCYPFAEMLDLDTPLITVNGGEIWSAKKELIERHVHDSEKMEEMWKLGRDIGVNMWIISTTKVYNGGDYPEDFSAHEWLKIGFSSEDLNKLDSIREGLDNYDDLELTNSLPTNIEVNPLGVNKANGIMRVCEEMNISMNEVMAVGDSLNDIKMIEQAGIGVAMGNAQTKIKEVADYTTDTNNADGVAKAIKHFIL